jgi:dTDP-4-dehydrorhamnose reductase
LVASAFKELAQAQKIPFYGFDLHGEKEPANILDLKDLTQKVKAKSQLIIEEGRTPVFFHFAAATFTGNNLKPEQIKLTHDLNITGTKNVLAACAAAQIPMIHISTDFVFAAGRKRTPYLPSDELAPAETPYSLSKAEAERVVLELKSDQHVNIIRLAFPYGNMHHPKMGLLRKMLTWMDQKEAVDLYTNQHICPTPISYFAQACLKTAQLIANEDILSGIILHLVGHATTPYEFGKLAKEIFQKSAHLNPVEIKSGPKNLVLDATDTDKYLDFKAPSHEEEMRKLSKNT